MTAALGHDSGERRHGPCWVCGRDIRAVLVIYETGTHWHLDQHPAPCGAPCVGGGVAPTMAGENNRTGLDHAHFTDRCGASGCKGGSK